MKKLIAVTLSSLCFLFARANVFIVTSNADSGPGTLREAINLANANGSAVVDYIHFNIADISVAGRTIAIQTSFADLKSNLVIDGSTQPGVKIGVSDAKIRLTTAPGAVAAHVFRIVNERNIFFFGMHLDDLKLNSASMITSAIALQNARNILIGEPGKGNYFTRLSTVARDAYFLPNGKGMNDSVAFKSNIVNLSEDGNTMVSSALLFAFDNVRNLTIGGEQEAEGNFISTNSDHVGWTYTDTNAHVNTGTYTVINNKFGCNYLQTAPLRCGSLYFRNGNSYGFTDATQIIIRKNTFNAACFNGSCQLYNFIMLSGKKGFIDIRANKFGHLTGNADFFFSSSSTAISIGGCEDGIIGGEDPADANFIAGQMSYGISLGGNKAIKISRNAIVCNSKGIRVSSSQLPVPHTKISSITDTDVKGTTLPRSTVEVFLTKRCAGCENGEKYLGSTLADDTGGWTFTSPELLNGAVTATGTSLQGVTGEFARPEYRLENNYSYQSPTCQQNNGYIKGVRYVAGTRYYWLRSHSGGVDTLFTEDVLNAGPGSYKFVVEQGKYCTAVHNVYLGDNSPKISAFSRSIVQPSCGLNNGRILNHYISGSYNKVAWKDSTGKVVGSNQELWNVGPGKYKLVILDTLYSCGDSTEFYTLVNQSGPSLLTNNVKITDAACDNSKGSITGITATNVTGTPQVRWVDSVNTIVGYQYDLQNVKPGKYRLKFKDASACDTITTPFYVVGNTGIITIDTTRRQINPATCKGNTGSITNIAVMGASRFEWRDAATGLLVGTTLNITNLPAGKYQLTAFNDLGCTQTAQAFTIPQAPMIPIGVSNFTSKLAFCGQPNGTLEPKLFSADTNHFSFRWVDSATNRTISTYTNVFGIYGSTYLLYATDSNGCERLIFTTVLRNAPVPSFDYSNLQITPDNCLSGKGAVSGITVKDLFNGTASYVWLNNVNDSIGKAVNIQNLAAGTYRLKATDLMGCSVFSDPIVVQNINTTLPAPRYEEQTVLKGTTATLTVRNSQPGRYQLFQDPLGATMLQENSTGIFTTPVLLTDQTFYVRYVHGVCNSDLVAVGVKVIDKNAIYVPTAFSPNADGKNDVLKPIPFGRVKLIHFTIYNRWGGLVFSSSDFSRGWNGTFQGKPVETGVYVWIVKAVDEIKGTPIEQKGSVTIIR